MTRRSRQLWVAGFCLALAGCADQADDDTWALPSAGTQAEFERTVLPVLLRDCGFHACHGSSERFFRVWGPGRVRIGASSAFDPEGATVSEAKASYDRALSFIDRHEPERSLLLRKGLATEAGGAGHLGADKFGRNLYRTTNSPGYVALSAWVYSVAAQQQP